MIRSTSLRVVTPGVIPCQLGAGTDVLVGTVTVGILLEVGVGIETF